MGYLLDGFVSLDYCAPLSFKEGLSSVVEDSVSTIIIFLGEDSSGSMVQLGTV